MTNAPASNGQPEESNQVRNIIIGGIGLLVALTGLIIIIAVLLALNPIRAADNVEIVRDLMVIVVALMMIVIGTALVVFLIQVARFVNLLTNEVQPIIESTTDTVNTVRGTALFISKHVTEPIVATAGTIGGISKVVNDVEMLRKAAGIVMQASAAASPTGARSTEPPPPPSPAPEAAPPPTPPEQKPEASADKQNSTNGGLIRDNF